MVDSLDRSIENIQESPGLESLSLNSGAFLLLRRLHESKMIIHGSFSPPNLPESNVEVLVLPYYMNHYDPPGLGSWGLRLDSGEITEARINTVPNAGGVACEITIKKADDSYRGATPIESDKLLALLDFIYQSSEVQTKNATGKFTAYRTLSDKFGSYLTHLLED